MDFVLTYAVQFAENYGFDYPWINIIFLPILLPLILSGIPFLDFFPSSRLDKITIKLIPVFIVLFYFLLGSLIALIIKKFNKKN